MEITNDILYLGVNDHLGNDWNGNDGGDSDLGDPVHAIAAGVVSEATDHGGGWGNVVRVVHACGEVPGHEVESLYAHLDTIEVRPSTYFATALAVVGLGLLIGTWVGRARWLILLGVPLSMALGISAAAEHVGWEHGMGGSVTWRPATLADVADRYEQQAGEAVLDLRSVTFTGADTQIAVDANLGSLEILLPPNVDTKVELDVNLASATVFGQSYDGPNREDSITDDGADGPGGGKLTLVVSLNLGSLEIHR